MRGGYLSNPQWHDYTSLFDLYETEQADVVFVGDSITAWCSFGELLPDYTVANRGIGSDVTEGVLNRLDNIICLEPKYIVIMIGINDVAKGIETEISGENMDQILERLSNALPDTTILLISVLPTASELEEQIVALNQLYEDTAIDYDYVKYIDLYSEFLKDGEMDTSLVSTDGCHLNGKG